MSVEGLDDDLLDHEGLLVQNDVETAVLLVALLLAQHDLHRLLLSSLWHLGQLEKELRWGADRLHAVRRRRLT